MFEKSDGVDFSTVAEREVSFSFSFSFSCGCGCVFDFCVGGGDLVAVPKESRSSKIEDTSFVLAFGFLVLVPVEVVESCVPLGKAVVFATLSTGSTEGSLITGGAVFAFSTFGDGVAMSPNMDEAMSLLEKMELSFLKSCDSWGFDSTTGFFVEGTSGSVLNRPSSFFGLGVGVALISTLALFYVPL